MEKEIPKPKTLSNCVKQAVVEWCKESTSHGLGNIVRAENLVIRLIWIVCLLGSAGFCVYLISEAIISYLSHPVSTSFSVIEEIPARFPTLSICDLNAFATDDLELYNNVTSIIDRLNLTIPTKPIMLSQMALKRQINYFLFTLNSSQKQAYGNNLDNSMYFCLFNGLPCKSNWFEYYFDFNLGNCYKFNSNGLLTVGKAGYASSLILQFVIGNRFTKRSFDFESGMRILIHNHTLASPLVYENGLSLSPGFNYDIKVSRTYFNRLGPPFSDCLKDLTNSSSFQTDVMKMMFNVLNLTTYNYQYCQNLAFQSILAKNCSCVDPVYLFTDPSIAKCLNGTQIMCQNTLFQQVYKDPDAYFGDQCPRECDYFEYNVGLSQSIFPSKWFFENSLKYFISSPNVAKRIDKMSYPEARDYFLSFNIYYNELNYNYIEESPYWDVFLLFSNIGGNLGLFVGMSFLSFVEIFELIFQLVQFVLIEFANRGSTPVVPFNDRKI